MAKSAITPVVDVRDTDHEAAARANTRALLIAAGTARLLADAGRPDLAEPVRRAAGRRLRRLLAAAAALTAAAAMTAPIAAQPAEAAVRQPSPVRIVLDGPTAVVRLNVTASVPTTARGGFGVLVGRRSLRYTSVVSEAWSGVPQIAVAIPVDACDLPLGAQRWELEDLGDGQVTGMLVTVLRRSIVSPGGLVPLGSGMAAGTVQVRHFDPQTGGYRPSQASPIYVQTLNGARWTTVATWTTDSTGTAAGVVTLPLGPQRVRYLRPDGATVATATSVVRTVNVI